MLMSLKRHPDDEILAAYSLDSLARTERQRVSVHLQACVQCQGGLRAYAALRGLRAEPETVAPRDVLARALASRAVGERVILPSPHVTTPARRRTWVAPLAAAVAAVMAAVVVLSLRASDVSAVGASSALQFTPAKPLARDTIRVLYRPMVGLFAGMDEVVLRGSFRIPGDDSYPGAVPRARVRPAATLKRQSDGSYVGTFVLPDTVVYASFGVEDKEAIHTDSHDGAAWEVLVHDKTGKPIFDALDQRTHQMMGLSWEEGYATAKRLTVLYPERIASWDWRRSFDGWLFGPEAADSIGRVYAPTLNALYERARTSPTVSEGDIASIFYRKYASAARGTAADSADFAYWLARTDREHPRHMQLAQYYAFRFTSEQYKQPRFMLDSLERLYARFAPVHGPGRNLVLAGERAAEAANDDSAVFRWTQREQSSNAADLVLALVDRKSFRERAMNDIRRMLATSSESLATRRGVLETRERYRQRASDARRNLLAALGRALIADGRVAAGIDTLNLASAGAWDPGLFRALRKAYRDAKDSAGVLAMNARLSIDPRTNVDSAAALDRAGRESGVARWSALVDSARREMVSTMLSRGSRKVMRGAPTLDDADGRRVSLKWLTSNQATAVILWSQNCGAAIERTPEIARTYARLTAAGKRVLFVVDEGRSKGVDAILAKKGWNHPVYYDTRGELTKALTSFGTPAFYVLDAAGRIRFDHVAEAAELIAQVDAVASERSTARIGMAIR